MLRGRDFEMLRSIDSLGRKLHGCNHKIIMLAIRRVCTKKNFVALVIIARGPAVGYQIATMTSLYQLPCTRYPLHGKRGPFKRMSQNRIIQKWGISFPDFVLFVNALNMVVPKRLPNKNTFSCSIRERLGTFRRGPLKS